MKKLALASVAFAGVTAFGAGDSFASSPGFVGFTSMTGFSYTDSAVWDARLGQNSPGGTSGTASMQIMSGKHVSITAVFAGSSGSHPDLFVKTQHCGVPGDICGGFPEGSSVLGDNSFEGSGSFGLDVGKKLSAFGFQLSPIENVDWGGVVSFFAAGVTTPIGTVTLSSLPFCRSTSNITGCHVPVFVGAEYPKGTITSATVSLSGTSDPLGIGKVFLSQAKIPEPATLTVLGAGLLGLGAVRRRRRGHDPANGSSWSPFGRWRVVDSPPDTKHVLE
jgi:hypothetical protein